MRLIWYNRDEISDQDMIRAARVADRLLGKKKDIQFSPLLLNWLEGSDHERKASSTLSKDGRPHRP